METIKNYLETMFANLPNTLEVNRAKDELYSMMEDKFTELINEGKPENEAIGIVISEFGNLDEIAESLGINKVMDEMEVSDRRVISQSEAENYVSDATRRRFFIGLGTLLCIFSPIGPIIFGSFGEAFHIEAIEAIGVVIMFLCVAAGVCLFVLSGFLMSDWKFIGKEPCSISYSTAEYLSREKSDNQAYRGVFLAVGIVLCIVSFIPVIVFDAFLGSSLIIITEGFAPAMIFMGVGVGVFFIIIAGAKDDAYDKLLSLNDSETVSGNYEPVKSVKSVKREYGNELAAALLTDYWRTVTCIYFIYSFLTFNWGSSWLIWPIAAVLRRPLMDLFSKK